MNLKKELVDQSAHFAGSFGAVLIAQALGADIGAAAGLSIGLSLGLVREITQHDTAEIWKLQSGSLLDLAFWTLGGLVGSFVI